MANGYIGKISALVTASTADLSRKLQGSTREFGRFANRVQSQIAAASRGARSSFDDIFTAAQRVERALQAGTALRGRRGAALIDPGEADRIRRVVSVTEGINRPAARARRSFEALSGEIRGALQPSLERMQRQVDFVNNRIEVFGTVSPAAFERTQRTIRETVVAFDQLAQAQQRLSGIATGRELQFSDPRLAENLARAQRAGQQALSLPAQAIASDPQISGLVQQINRVSELAVVAAARVKSAFTPGDTAKATAEYDRLNTVLESLLGRLNKKYQVVIDTEAAKKRADALRAELDFALTGRPQDFSQVEGVYRRLRSEVEKLAVAQRAAFAPNLGRLGDLISSGDASKLREARAIIDRIEADLASTKKLNIDTEAAQSRLKAVRDGLREVAALLSGAPRDPFELLKRSAEQAKQAVDRVSDASRRQQLQQRLAGVQASIAADAGNANLSQAQLARLAARRARDLDQITASASARSATDIFGPALGSARGRIDDIQSRIASLQSGIAALPSPLQTRLIPALNRARDAFAALGTSPAAAEIANASRQARNLERQLLRAQQAAQFRGTFRNFLNDTSASRYAAQLESVQRQLAAVGATAGGPVASAINVFRRELAASANAGTLGTQRTRREMDQYVQAIARATVETGLLTQAQANAFRRSVATAGVRQGDIGRFGVDRLSLGLNQLAFAIDDLFSASGGLEQKIRAVSNNITQLGFVTGGTIGLFIGLGAVIGGQVVLAYQRFINKGVETQDRVKQLNEAAKRQRDLVKQLAQAFNELSDDLAQRGLTEATRRAEQLADRLRDVTKNLQELRRQRLADVDPDVQEARRQQAVFRRRLDAAETPGSRIAIQARLDQQIEAERQATARVLDDALNVDIAGSINNIVEQIFREQLAGIADAGGVQAQTGVPFLDRAPESRQFRIDTARARAESAFSGVDLGNIAEVRAAAVAQRDRLVNVAEQRTAVGFRTGAAARAEEALAVVERLIRQIDDVEQQAAIGSAAEGVAEAVNSVDSVLPGFLRRIEEASEFARTPSLALQQEVEGLVQALRQQADAIRKAREEGDLDAANQASSRAKSIADEIVARERQVAAVENTSRTIQAFADVIERVSSQLAESIVSDARNAADQARRSANRLAGIAESGLGQPREAEFAQRQRRRQEEALADVEGRAAEARRQERELFFLFQQQAESGALGARAQELIRRRDEAQAVLDNQGSTAVERAAAQATIEEANERLRQFYESLPGVQAISGFLDSLDSAAQAAIELGNAVEQGRKLVLTDAQRTADDFIAQVQQLNAAREAGEIDQAQRREAIERLRQEGFRQLAPTIFGLAGQVQNAVLQGPSRAALQATDVSTIEGNSELNRLLRGDDSARDQPLVELQREANRIAERIARGVENNEAQIAN
jgi:hypothetical protein